MQIKQFLFSMVVMGGLVMAGVGAVSPTTAYADGGMMVVNTTTSAPVTITPQLSVEQRIAYLEQLVKLYVAVQSLTMAIPAVENEDEGQLTVVINDTMRFACEDKVVTSGEWCVRHVGDLGETYIAVEDIKGFPYDERFAFDVTLMKVRAETYGEVGASHYDYYLQSLNTLTYQR